LLGENGSNVFACIHQVLGGAHRQNYTNKIDGKTASSQPVESRAIRSSEGAIRAAIKPDSTAKLSSMISAPARRQTVGTLTKASR
jgi:hypothetical protein